MRLIKALRLVADDPYLIGAVFVRPHPVDHGARRAGALDWLTDADHALCCGSSATSRTCQRRCGPRLSPESQLECSLVLRTAQEQRHRQSHAARLPNPPGSRPSSACGQRPTAGRSARALGVTDAMTCDNQPAVRASSSRGPRLSRSHSLDDNDGARRSHDRQFRSRGSAWRHRPGVTEAR